VTRLYQWLRERAMLFRVESHDDGTCHSVRTEVTVHEREQTLLLEGTSWGGPKTCPLCGNPMFPVPEPLSEEKAQELKLGHRDGQGTCPGPKQQSGIKSSRQSEDRRRLR
jgi:hypothetical protein